MLTAARNLLRTLRPLLFTALCGVLLFLPLALILQRPPQHPQLTLFGTGDSLSLLLEGAGGGRVLVGGGATLSDLPALLGRHFLPFDRQIDLLIVADRRDLPGATELVRRDMVRAVATVGLVGQREASAGLANLATACAARNVPLRAIEADEQITVGSAEPLTLSIAPPATTATPPLLRVHAGPFAAPILLDAATDNQPALGAILLRANQETFAFVVASDARLIVSPTPPATLAIPTPEGRYLLQLGAGERATLRIEDQSIRLRGARLVPLDLAAQQP